MPRSAAEPSGARHLCTLCVGLSQAGSGAAAAEDPASVYGLTLPPWQSRPRPLNAPPGLASALASSRTAGGTPGKSHEGLQSQLSRSDTSRHPCPPPPTTPQSLGPSAWWPPEAWSGPGPIAPADLQHGSGGDPRCPGLPPRGGHAGRSVVRGPPTGAEIAGNSELGTDGAHTARGRRGRPASLAPLVLAELRPEQGSAHP